MAWPDAVNACFEFFGGTLIWLSVKKLHKDKMVRGVHWAPVAFFSAWGYWNLFYYAHLDQWLSWIGGVNIVLANSVWAGQMLYYVRKEKHGPQEHDGRDPVA